MKIYERVYDAPLNKDGIKKPNKLLGDFRIIQTMFIDMYSSRRLGIKNGKYYLIEEKEVSYDNGGSKFYITKLNLSPHSKPEEVGK